jgi:hypothetical protein
MTARFFLHCQACSAHSGLETLRPWCGQTLDRVENGGSGSDLNARERKDGKGSQIDKQALFRLVMIQPATVLEAAKARPGNLRGQTEERPKRRRKGSRS